MNSNKDYNYYINQNYIKNDINIIKNNIPNKNNLFTDSDNEEIFTKNYNTEKIINNNNKNDIKIISNTAKSKNKDIIKMEKVDNNYYHINHNNHDNTIPISKKSQKTEIQNIDNILKYLKEGNNNSKIKNEYNTNYENNIFKSDKINTNISNIEELKTQKEILIIKLKKIKQKNKELMTQLEPYRQSMTNQDIENEQRLKYIKYLDDKRKEYILINNKLRHKLMNNQNINIKKKIEYLINKQIKEYEKLYNNDLLTNKNFNEIKIKNVYTNNNLEMKCELSLSGVNNNSDYKLNNATTDGLINSIHKNIINENINININNKKSFTKNNKLNKNNSIIIGEDKNKNNNSLKFKKNNSKSNFLSSIKYIKNSKITRNNNNTSSSITSSHDNNNNINNKNNINKKNDFKLLKPNTKMTNGINFGMK